MIARAVSLLTLLLLLSPRSVMAADEAAVLHLIPSGARRGSTVEVLLRGSVNGKDSRRAWTSHPGLVVTFGKKNDRIKVEVKADVPPGRHWIRLANEGAASSPLAFVVSAIEEIAEKEPNNSSAEAQILKSRQCVVNGVLAKSRDVDSYRVSLRKGQTLVASMTANTALGSPMDGLIQVVSARGFVLAQDDDSLGLDPFIAWTARRDGDYYVRVFAFPSKTNSSIQLAGGPEFVYRLTITTAPYVDFTIPSAFTGKAPRALQVIGWNLEKSQQTWTVDGKTQGVSDQYFHAGWSNTISLKRVTHSSQVESEPNGRKKPQIVSLPVTISGRIGAARDRDVFSFEAKKGQALRISVESRQLGFPLDPVIRISDGKGKKLAETDTRSASTIDESITWTAPAKGKFLAEVRDLFDHGGPRYSYRLTIEPVVATVSATVEKDRWEVADKPLSIKLTVTRSGGFNKPVRFEAVELPAGVIAKPVISEPKGATAKAVALVLSRKPDAPARGSGVLRIVGRVDGVKDAVTVATAAIDRLPDRTEHLWLFLKPAAQKKKKKKK